MTVFGKSILSLFIRDEAELADQVLAIGYDFLRVMAAGLPMLYLLFVYRTTLQGLGDTVMPMISGFWNWRCVLEQRCFFLRFWDIGEFIWQRLQHGLVRELF